jgi:hypothetical protein
MYACMYVQHIQGLGQSRLSATDPALLIVAPESESESYITTDSQSASLYWNKAPIWDL